MFKKCMLSFLIICLILSMNTMIFADDLDVKEELEDYVHIINPEVGTSGKAILNDTLFISIYVQSKEDLVLELIKVDAPLFEEVAVDLGEDLEEKVTSFDFNEEEADTKEDIIKAYQKVSNDLEVVETSYNQAKVLIKDLPVVEGTTSIFDEDYELTEADEENLQFVDTMASRFNEVLLSYNYWEKRYLDLFQTPILEDIKISVDPSFPYFEYTVDHIDPGQYKLFVKSQDGQILEEMNFEIVTEENIADEIIEENSFFDSSLDNLFE